MATAHDPDQEPANLHYLGVILGGLLVGGGIVSLWYSFGDPSGELNGNMARIGFSGLDNIELLPAADYSLVSIAAGLLLMVFLNAGAWRSTGGY